MAKKRYTMEQIIAKLRAAEIEPGKGRKTPDACRILALPAHESRSPRPAVTMILPPWA